MAGDQEHRMETLHYSRCSTKRSISPKAPASAASNPLRLKAETIR